MGLAEEDCTYDITPPHTHTHTQSKQIERAFAHKQNLPISSATLKKGASTKYYLYGVYIFASTIFCNYFTLQDFYAFPIQITWSH